MNALRYIQKVTSDSILIKDLGEFTGKEVEIIILPLEENRPEAETKKKQTMKGYFEKYGNPSLVAEEKKAWHKAIKKKHGTG